MRKLALIGDSHGNYQALKAVLEDAQKQNVDDYIVLGDITNRGPEPLECVEALQQVKPLSIINLRVLRITRRQLWQSLLQPMTGKNLERKNLIGYLNYHSIKKLKLKELRSIFSIQRRLNAGAALVIRQMSRPILTN